MTILVAGGTGFLGTALSERLRADGHRVIVLTRRPRTLHEIQWSPAERPLHEDRPPEWIRAIDGADAVINLAGESIAGRRWTQARKHAIRASRVEATRALVAAITTATHIPPVFISSSAIGIYGSLGDQPVTEQASPGDDFLASVCRDWEALALEATATSRVVLLRTGLVLAREGGALPQLALPFTLFAGGPVGTGRQYMSWISVTDWVGMVRWALSTSSVSGPLNLTAPSPVTNAQFARVLGRVLHRPALIPAPSFALRIALGEMADALILGGQRVLPAKAQALGFEFAHTTLEPALRDIYRTSREAGL
jgi:uncharacterized protein (TIGR01777 family)